jgi:hypothetical protein
MAAYRFKFSWIIRLAFVLIFAFLFTLRLGIFEKKDTGTTIEDRPFHAQTQMDRETWMNIYQQEQKIGYVHRQIFKTLEGYKRTFASITKKLWNDQAVPYVVRFRFVASPLLSADRVKMYELLWLKHLSEVQ